MSFWVFVLSYEDNADQTSYKRYIILTIEIKDYSVMINGQSVSDQPVKKDIRTYDKIQEITTS